MPAGLAAAVSHSRSDARFKFLTADGQNATPLEQEALLGTNDLVEASFLDRCLSVRECVGRLRFTTPRGRAYATGFTIAPGLVMTNRISTRHRRTAPANN
jgi:endonuclease G